MGQEAPCVSVLRGMAGDAIRMLKSRGMLRGDLRVESRGDEVLIPVVDQRVAVESLASGGIEARPCTAEFRQRRPRGPRLPPGISGYHLVGDIIVIHRRLGGPSMEEYRRAAEELLEFHRGSRAVYLKEDTWGEYRVQRLTLLAGSPGTVTVHKEYGLRFKVDVARAYFNPRLGFEHRRVAERVSDGEVVLDMFTGVGGFAIHIASLRRALVVAVDLNPVAAGLAAENVALNKGRLRGRVVVVRADSSRLHEAFNPVFDRVIMNHPTLSHRFLWEACRLLRGPGVIHYYTLTTSCLDAEEEMREWLPGCCSLDEASLCRRVLDYNPSYSVYTLEARVTRRA